MEEEESGEKELRILVSYRKSLRVGNTEFHLGWCHYRVRGISRIGMVDVPNMEALHIRFALFRLVIQVANPLGRQCELPSHPQVQCDTLREQGREL